MIQSSWVKCLSIVKHPTLTNVVIGSWIGVYSIFLLTRLAHLKYVKGNAYRPGLLIHVIETSNPDPEVSENGHPLDCACRECKPLICLECNVHP